jgi:hypothetical protein
MKLTTKIIRAESHRLAAEKLGIIVSDVRESLKVHKEYHFNPIKHNQLHNKNGISTKCDCDYCVILAEYTRLKIVYKRIRSQLLYKEHIVKLANEEDVTLTYLKNEEKIRKEELNILKEKKDLIKSRLGLIGHKFEI